MVRETNAITGNPDGFILLVDSVGNYIWDRTFPMNNNQAYFRNFQQTSDSGFIVCGFVFTGASGNQDAWLVKLDSNGCDNQWCAPAGIEEHPVVNSEFRFFPNPSNGIFRTWNHSFEEMYHTEIYNSMGRTDTFNKGRNSFYQLNKSTHRNLFLQSADEKW